MDEQQTADQRPGGAERPHKSGVAAPGRGGRMSRQLLWVRTFEIIEELRQALLAFRDTYKATWVIERHGFITPEAFRQKQLQAIAKAA